MFITDLLFALAIALLLTTLFAMLFRGMRSGSGLWLFFLILFLASWAGGIWLTPFGPILYGVSWMSFLMIGLFIALILTALIPPVSRTRSVDPATTAGSETAAVFVMDVFFWLLLLGLLVAIFLAYR